MPSRAGSPNQTARDFAELYEHMIQETGTNPVVVLFKLMRARSNAIKLQAAKELLQYRYPKQASVVVQPEAAAQMVLLWDDHPELEQPSDEELEKLTAITAEFEEVPDQ